MEIVWITYFVGFAIYVWISLMIGNLFISGYNYQQSSNDEQAFRVTLFFLNLFVGTFVWPLGTIVVLTYLMYCLSFPAGWALSGAVRHTKTLAAPHIQAVRNKFARKQLNDADTLSGGLSLK